MFIRHSGPLIVRLSGHGVRPGLSRLSFVFLTHLPHFPFDALPTPPPSTTFSRQEMADCLLIRPFARRCYPVWRALSFIDNPAGNPTPVSITTAPSVCVVGSWVVLRQSSCHTPFVIVALLLLNHSSSSSSSFRPVSPSTRRLVD